MSSDNNGGSASDSSDYSDTVPATTSKLAITAPRPQQSSDSDHIDNGNNSTAIFSDPSATRCNFGETSETSEPMK